MQDEITHKITLEMRVQFAEGEQLRLRAGGTDSVEARELVFRTWELLDRHIRGEMLEARGLAEAALKIDPDHAHGWLALGWSHWFDVYWGWSESVDASLNQARKATQRG